MAGVGTTVWGLAVRKRLASTRSRAWQVRIDSQGAGWASAGGKSLRGRSVRGRGDSGQTNLEGLLPKAGQGADIIWGREWRMRNRIEEYQTWRMAKLT